MRKIKFVKGEFYHIYNRGVDRRSIFSNKYDIERFLQCMDEFNTVSVTGGLYQNSFATPAVKTKQKSKRLVNIVAYCLNPNHYHLILEQLAEGGISQLMKRLGGGYSWYFNNRYQRSGALFQGSFKAKLIDSNEYLLYLSAYINLNFKIHQLSNRVAKLVRSSWEEYTTNQGAGICKKGIILNQLGHKKDYKKFALDALPDLIEKRKITKEIAELLIE